MDFKQNKFIRASDKIHLSSSGTTKKWKTNSIYPPVIKNWKAWFFWFLYDRTCFRSDTYSNGRIPWILNSWGIQEIQKALKLIIYTVKENGRIQGIHGSLRTLWLLGRQKIQWIQEFQKSNVVEYGAMNVWDKRWVW
jgi:hypothetical protein